MQRVTDCGCYRSGWSAVRSKAKSNPGHRALFHANYRINVGNMSCCLPAEPGDHGASRAKSTTGAWVEAALRLHSPAFWVIWL